MIGLGTIINTAAIIFGGIIGHFTGKLFKQDQQAALFPQYRFLHLKEL